MRLFHSAAINIEYPLGYSHSPLLRSHTHLQFLHDPFALLLLLRDRYLFELMSRTSGAHVAPSRVVAGLQLMTLSQGTLSYHSLIFKSCRDADLLLWGGRNVLLGCCLGFWDASSQDVHLGSFDAGLLMVLN